MKFLLTLLFTIGMMVTAQSQTIGWPYEAVLEKMKDNHYTNIEESGTEDNTYWLFGNDPDGWAEGYKFSSKTDLCIGFFLVPLTNEIDALMVNALNKDPEIVKVKANKWIIDGWIVINRVPSDGAKNSNTMYIYTKYEP